MRKQILLLSAALCALSASPAFAQTDPLYDITTALTAPIDTATANPDGSGTPADILLDAGGSITLNFAGAAITLNSNNSVNVNTGTTISNTNTTNAAGILVDLTTQSWDATNDAASCGSLTPPCHTTEGILMNGTIDLSGTGTNKTGIWLEGPASDSGLSANSFTGDIDMSNSTIKLVGDSSIGVLIDSLAIENGNLSFGTLTTQVSSVTGSTLGVIAFENNGVINGNVNIGFVDTVNDIDNVANITSFGSTSSSASGTIGLNLTGTINGNLTIDTGSGVAAYGTGAQGIVITGAINPLCDAEDPPVCSSLGTLINRGIILTAGTTTASGNLTGNATSGSALLIEASIAGGIYNAGPTHGDSTITLGQITSQSVAGTVTFSPASATSDPIDIGIYQGDTEDAGFSFYNRGVIRNGAPNVDQSVLAFVVAGQATASTTFEGGIFNSYQIIAATTTDKNGALMSATGMQFGTNTIVGASDTYTYDGGCDCFNYNPEGTKTVDAFGYDDRAALVNSGVTGNGLISASITGESSDTTAVAINIAAGATLPSILNSGTISAAATTDLTSLTGLTAIAIQDASGTLTSIDNEGGTIQAIATTLDDGTQKAIAINLSADRDSGSATGQGIQIVNHATGNHAALIFGDILFGTGSHQIVDVLGIDSAHTATISGDIVYGAGGIEGSDELNVGDFASVTGKITADAQAGVKVDVKDGGTLTITNDTTALSSAGFHIEDGGTLNLTVLEDFKSGTVVSVGTDPINDAIALDPLAKLNITYGSWIPDTSKFVLFTGTTINIDDATTQLYNQELNDPGKLPFLFNSATLSLDPNNNGTESYVLTVAPKSAADLGLTGYAAQMLPFASQALAFDDKLGGAFINGIVDQKSAQTAFTQLAPDVTGGARAIAMSLTDQATGPVAARQRMLRMYGKDSGEVTLWGQEFAEFVKDPGNTKTGQTGFKDHGFGFALGLDGGDPKIGWYGGALSFYSGDIVEAYPRDSHANVLTYMLTGYTDWRGRGLFLDTKLDVAYMTTKQKRYIALNIPNATGTGTTPFLDEADSNRPGLVGSAGFTTGVILAYGSTTLTPQMSMDAMTMRQEGVAETHPTTSPGNGQGFDLATKAFYSNSLRVFLGADLRQDLDLGDFFLQPDVRLGYRYDFLNDPTKVTAHFVATPNADFTIIGPDPSQGNFVAGASLAATTDAWTLGANFDFVRGTNGATTEVGTIHLLGRI